MAQYLLEKVGKELMKPDFDEEFLKTCALGVETLAAKLHHKLVSHMLHTMQRGLETLKASKELGVGC